MIKETVEYESLADLRRAIESRISQTDNMFFDDDIPEAVISLDCHGDVGWFLYDYQFLDKHDFLVSGELAMNLVNDPKLVYLIHIYYSKAKPEEYNKEQLW